MIIAGITVLVTTAAAIKIGKEVGIRWDGEKKNWENFKTDITERIGKLIHSKQWIEIHSEGGRALMTAIYYNDAGAAGAGGGKKDDKWYFEARIHDHQIEINPKLMSEEQAVKEMGRGKNIMTVSKNLARKVVERYEGKTRPDLKFEISQKTREGYYEHLNFEAHDMRLHCWVWRP